MARARLYVNNAEKQAAYRARHPEQRRPPQRLLAHLGQELHGRLREAIRAGSNRVPASLLGPGADDTLINLIGYVSGVSSTGERE
jgi:acyl CoA:acetate/3-ketoacid CoA transferase alpha subunit